MKSRNHWIRNVLSHWERRSIVWLSGARRVGKTVLCKQIDGAAYFNCDLPSVQRRLEDPEFFLSQLEPERPVIFDEVHQIRDPSSLLKIAADEFPRLRVLATGSSTLQATRKFRDSLSGRKLSIDMKPVLWRECGPDFGITELDRRLLHGGFPEMLLAETPDPSFFEEWMASFFARDIQELFRVRNRGGFLNLLRLVCLRSSGQLSYSDLAKDSGLSRPTVLAHLDALEIAHAAARIPPYHGGGHREITRQPKIYALDTGLISHVCGFERIRDADRGHLWEHLVLDELRTAYSPRPIHYWRDKNQREVDFVVAGTTGAVHAFEAKINSDAFDTTSLLAFREIYPRGDNFLICPRIDKSHAIRRSGLTIQVMDTGSFPQ